MKENINYISCVSFTFSSFEANKDSIPAFNLWYSWSNEEKKEALKALFLTHSYLMSCEFEA